MNINNRIRNLPANLQRQIRTMTFAQQRANRQPVDNFMANALKNMKYKAPTMKFLIVKRGTKAFRIRNWRNTLIVEHQRHRAASTIRGRVGNVIHLPARSFWQRKLGDDISINNAPSLANLCLTVAPAEVLLGVASGNGEIHRVRKARYSKRDPAAFLADIGRLTGWW